MKVDGEVLTKKHVHNGVLVSDQTIQADSEAGQTGVQDIRSQPFEVQCQSCAFWLI